MSQENVELVRRAYEAWNAGEFEEAAEVLSPEIEWRLPPNVPDTDTWRSRKEIEQGLEAFMESWAELRAVVRDLRGAGDKVVALVQCQRRSAVTGLALEGAGVWTLRDGKAVKVEMHSGTQDHRDEAASLESLSSEKLLREVRPRRGQASAYSCPDGPLGKPPDQRKETKPRPDAHPLTPTTGGTSLPSLARSHPMESRCEDVRDPVPLRG